MNNIWQISFLTGSTQSSTLVDQNLIGAFFKLLFVLVAFLYLAFAFVVTRQIKVMRTTLVTPFSPIVRLVGYLHFGLALLVLMAFIFFLWSIHFLLRDMYR